MGRAAPLSSTLALAFKNGQNPKAEFDYLFQKQLKNSTKRSGGFGLLSTIIGYYYSI